MSSLTEPVTLAKKICQSKMHYQLHCLVNGLPSSGWCILTTMVYTPLLLYLFAKLCIQDCICCIPIKLYFHRSCCCIMCRIDVLKKMRCILFIKKNSIINSNNNKKYSNNIDDHHCVVL